MPSRPCALASAYHSNFSCLIRHFTVQLVNAVRLLPKSAHLLLSASMDGKVKLWEVYGKRRQLRTFHGHTMGVRDIAFNNDGSR